ncbi:MAG: DUF2169 domain-containing protein [Chitinivibrionales bacterium]|nr:DUF2169 domain-containing protein [Chitinivibrionales bacterium]
MSWQFAFIPGSKPEAQPIISVIGKRTYTLAPGRVEVADEQLPVYDMDGFEDEENQLYSEALGETDLIPFKPSTDVVIQGKVHAPKGKKAFHLDCEVRVGPYRKTVRTFGNRTAQSKALRGIVISDPEPFTEMPLGYTRAYGGIATSKNGTLFQYYPNPIGKGFGLRGGVDDGAGMQVPNLEDPGSPVLPDHLALPKFEDWEHGPKPASLGWTRRNFFPRYTFAGVLPEYLEAAQRSQEEMQKKYPQLGNTKIPKMDYRVYQGASDGLWGQRLKGDEHVLLTYMDPDFPKFEFDLPNDIPLLTLDVGEGPQQLQPELQTVVIEMEEKRLSLVWRGYLEYGGIEELASVARLEANAFSRENN